jgi:hypothetical protein
MRTSYLVRKLEWVKPALEVLPSYLILYILIFGFTDIIISVISRMATTGSCLCDAITLEYTGMSRGLRNICQFPSTHRFELMY